MMEATVSMTILDTVLPLFINSCPQTIVVLLTLPGYSTTIRLSIQLYVKTGFRLFHKVDLKGMWQEVNDAMKPQFQIA